MNHDDHQDVWEERVRDTARNFSYPPTPDIASKVSSSLRPRPARALRRLVQAAALLLLILAGLMAVPEIRAAVIEALHIGSISIFTFTTPTSSPTPTSTPTVHPTPTVHLAQTANPTALPTLPLPRRVTITPFPTPVPSVLDLPGETTFDDALEQSRMSIQLPTYPADLGPPNRVFFQRIGGPVVTLVWVQPGNPTQVRLALQVLDETATASKYDSSNGQPTVVNHLPAYWLTDSHEIIYWDNNGGQFTRIVNANVLVWTAGRLTYRLESDLPLEEAVRVAESLH